MKKNCCFLFIFIVVLFCAGCDRYAPIDYPLGEVVPVDADEKLVNHHVAGYAEGFGVPDPENPPIGTFQAKLINETDPEADNAGTIKAALLVNETDGDCLVSVNGYERIYPASMTKVMSGILIMEALDAGKLHMDDVITIDKLIDLPWDAARLDLHVGDTITVKNLIYGYLIRSLNDCGVELGRLIAGSDEAFIGMMNDKAVSIGATHSHFVNCHGMHHDDHYTTPYDLYLIFKEFAKYPLVQEIDGIKAFTLTYLKVDEEGVQAEESLDLKSTNGYLTGGYRLPSGYEIGAWKSGTTKKAGYCLIMQVFHDGKTYYAVVCKGDKRDSLYKSMTDLLMQIK